jgi:hypothetical protein
MNTTTKTKKQLPRKSAPPGALTSVYRSLYRSRRHRRTITAGQMAKTGPRGRGLPGKLRFRHRRR